MADDPRRHLPSVAVLLELSSMAPLIDQYGRDTVVSAIRATLDRLRADMSTAADHPADDVIAAQVHSLR